MCSAKELTIWDRGLSSFGLLNLVPPVEGQEPGNKILHWLSLHFSFALRTPNP